MRESEMGDTYVVPEEVWVDLFSLAASPAVALGEIQEAVLDAALEGTSADAGGAVCFRAPESGQDFWHFRAVGGTRRSELARETPGADLAALADGDEPVCLYCKGSSPSGDEGFFFRESRSLVCVPLRCGGAVRGKLQVEATSLRAFSARHRLMLSELGLLAGLLLDRLLLSQHAGAVGLDIHPVGRSRQYLLLEGLLKQIASDSSSPVLIRGERGSGKELAAYAVHYFGRRRDKPFVPVNSATFTEDLAADELFGHVGGAFTGANVVRAGLFRSAHQGSLFFDEIGDMPARVQAHLLRVLDHGEVRRVGCDEPAKVDVRVIAATNQDLERLIAEGKFRNDLYDRLNVLQVRVPPLREREEDLDLLADFFLKKACPGSGAGENLSGHGDCQGCREANGGRCIHTALHEMLSGHDFPGNVRDLRNLVFRFVATFRREEPRAGRVLRGWLPDGGNAETAATLRHGACEAADLRLDRVIRSHIRNVLDMTSGNKSAAARILDIPLTTMINKMKRLGMS